MSGEQVNYTHDSLNRLATAVTPDNANVTQWGQSYSFDGFGNLTAQTVIKGSAPVYSASYNPANNQQYSDCPDANGNVFGLASCAGSNAYSYDTENRLLLTPAGVHYS